MRDAKKYLKKAEQENLLLAWRLGATSSKELISITDVQNRFIYVNKAFLDCYGYTENEIIGKTPSILVSAHDPAAVAQQVHEKAMKSGFTLEIVNRRKDGTEFPIALSTSQVGGKIVGVLGADRFEGELRFTEEEFRITRDFANQASLALAQYKLNQQGVS